MRLRWPIGGLGRSLLAAGAIGLVVVQPGSLTAQPKDKKDAPVGIGAPNPPQPWPPPGQPAPLAQPHRPPMNPGVGALPGMMVILFAVLALQIKLRNEEEEEVTPLSADPSTTFEYKIMRSALGAFRKPEKFRAMLEEEGHAGWELFEKLDDARVRLRRPVVWRDRDADLTQDPYRTRFGGGEGKVALWIILGVFGVLALVAAVLAIVLNK